MLCKYYTQGQYVGSWVIGGGVGGAGGGPGVDQQHQVSVDLSKVSLSGCSLHGFVIIRVSAAVTKQLQYDTTFSLAVICFKYCATPRQETFPSAILLCLLTIGNISSIKLHDSIVCSV